MLDADPIPVPLRAVHLDLLQWFGEWTPEVHRADWQKRRRWPPGWRYLADQSVYHAKQPPPEVCAPHPKQNHALVRYLLQYGLIEGSWRRIFRLTMRGRCALKLAQSVTCKVVS